MGIRVAPTHILQKPGEKGSTLIGALLLVMLLGFLGSSLVQLGSTGTSNSSNIMQGYQALYVGHAGLEYAKRRTDYGYDPDGESRNLGKGTFTITTDPMAGLVTVLGQVGNAKRIQSITTTFSTNCAQLDTTDAYMDNHTLFGIKIVKVCNAEAILTHMLFDCQNPDPRTRVKLINLENTTIYNPGSIGSPGGGGADLGEMIDVEDYVMAPNQDYSYDYYDFIGNPDGIRFMQPPPGDGSCTITAFFNDNSSSSGPF